MVQPLPLLFALLLVGVDAILHLRGQDEGKQCMKEVLQHRAQLQNKTQMEIITDNVDGDHHR